MPGAHPTRAKGAAHAAQGIGCRGGSHHILRAGRLWRRWGQQLLRFHEDLRRRPDHPGPGQGHLGLRPRGARRLEQGAPEREGPADRASAGRRLAAPEDDPERPDQVRRVRRPRDRRGVDLRIRGQPDPHPAAREGVPARPDAEADHRHDDVPRQDVRGPVDLRRRDALLPDRPAEGRRHRCAPDHVGRADRRLQEDPGDAGGQGPGLLRGPVRP